MAHAFKVPDENEGNKLFSSFKLVTHISEKKEISILTGEDGFAIQHQKID